MFVFYVLIGKKNYLNHTHTNMYISLKFEDYFQEISSVIVRVVSQR